MNEKLNEILWAKTQPYKKLYTHMLETGIVSRVLMEESAFTVCLKDLADNLGVSTDETMALICYITSLHDIGKCHPLFQGKNKDTSAAQYLERESELEYPFWADDYRHEIGSYTSLGRIRSDRSFSWFSQKT